MAVGRRRVRIGGSEVRFLACSWPRGAGTCAAAPSFEGASATGFPAPAVCAAELVEVGALDAPFEKIDAGNIQLSGHAGLIPELIKSVLEWGLQADMSANLGYERGDSATSLFANSRNGVYLKAVSTEVECVPLEVPRDRLGGFTLHAAAGAERRPPR